MNKLKRIGLVQLVVGIVLVTLITVFIYRKRIANHKVTKAKMELFKRMTNTQPNEWDDEFKQVYDSMFTNQIDSTLQQNQ